MIFKIFKRAGIFFFAVTVFSSCILDQEEASTAFLSSDDFAIVSTNLSILNDLPNYSNSSEEMRDYAFDAKALLGRVLFHDKNLSIDNSVSCESCHHQELGFADDKAFSEGINGQFTERNSIAFSAVGSDNSEFNPYFGGDDSFGGAKMFWDHRAESVTDQLLETIENTVEMGMPMEQLIPKLQGIDYMQVLFENSYGVGNNAYRIAEEDVLDALLKFLQSMNPSNSKFDQFIESNDVFSGSNTPVVNLTSSEELGSFLFSNSCASCHGEGKQQPVGFTKNNGLDNIYEDLGAGDATFKVPALRNIALSGPYMHDGRFETLEEVIEHYSSGIKNHPSKSFELPSGGFNFTEEEKLALLNFMNALTDESFIEDERFSDPFKS